MEGTSGPSVVPPMSPIDKSRVLDVKPLRTLVPAFPDPPQAPPFVSSSPFGPFPPGCSPFYPFSVPKGAYNTAEDHEQQDEGYPSPASAVPLRSFGAPQMGHGAYFSGGVNGDTGSSVDLSEEGYVGGRKRATRAARGSDSSQKKAKKVRAPYEKREKAVYPGLSLSLPEQEDGNRELVNYVMLKFDSVRRKLSQLEESKGSHFNRPDLRAGNILLTAGIRVNSRRRVGAVPGVEIGDVFYFRMELCVLGLHAPSMAGIDYITLMKGGSEEETVAVSIVSSGGYDDDANDKDVLIYTGHGGNKAATDQKLERGNLALDKSFRKGNEIRVIRGIRDSVNPLNKIYVYDGLYTIADSWIDKGKSGASSFKYKMVRLPGQPSAFAVWQSVQKWREGVSSRSGLILPDLTSGAETIPVSLVNDIDDEKGPPCFTYVSTIKNSNSFNLSQPSSGCNCRKGCTPGDVNCSCVHKNGGDFPYTGNGVLVNRKPLVYECGSSCPCMPTCKNRVLQGGIKARLEVFKTKDRGWGLRSWDPIRSGTFICEYAGEVIDKAKFDRDQSGNNDYIFCSTGARDGSFRWNYDSELIDEEATPGDMNEEPDLPSSLIINAKDVGNVGRFINHSCTPNVFWQLIVTEKNGESLLRVGFFAIRHIPPMTELTYDYGISESERGRKQCLCGHQKCKGYFG